MIPGRIEPELPCLTEEQFDREVHSSFSVSPSASSQGLAGQLGDPGANTNSPEVGGVPPPHWRCPLTRPSIGPLLRARLPRSCSSAYAKRGRGYGSPHAAGRSVQPCPAPMNSTHENNVRCRSGRSASTTGSAANPGSRSHRLRLGSKTDSTELALLPGQRQLPRQRQASIAAVDVRDRLNYPAPGDATFRNLLGSDVRRARPALVRVRSRAGLLAAVAVCEEHGVISARRHDRVGHLRRLSRI